MPKTCELTAIAFSPWTSEGIITYCDSQKEQSKVWYWNNTKSGMQTIIMHRRIVLFATIIMSISSLPPVDTYTLLTINLVTGVLMAYSLGSLYVQSKKIQGIVEPYLKINCAGAEEVMVPRGAAAPVAQDYGSARSLGDDKV